MLRRLAAGLVLAWGAVVLLALLGSCLAGLARW